MFSVLDPGIAHVCFPANISTVSDCYGWSYVDGGVVYARHYVPAKHFSNWIVFSAYFLSMAITDREGSSPF